VIPSAWTASAETFWTPSLVTAAVESSFGVSTTLIAGDAAKPRSASAGIRAMKRSPTRVRISPS
jgi:hypothetical protein